MPSGYGPTASATASAATSAAASSTNTKLRIRSAPIRSATLAAGLRAGEDAVELRLAHRGLVEQLDEIARDAADVLGKFFRIEQAGDPAQPDHAVDRGRRVDPAERQARRQIDALVAHGRHRGPHRIGRIGGEEM